MKARRAPQSFPKGSRLLRRAQFQRVYDEGQRRSMSLCTIFFKPNGLPESRLGITVTAKLGNAVWRNRVKRRLREVFRLHRQSIPGGWDMVLNPRMGAATAAFSTLEGELLRLFPQSAPASRAPGPPSR